MDLGQLRQALIHADVPGAGAARRRSMGLKGRDLVHADMAEYKRGTLRSGGSGQPINTRKQAIAVALSEAGLSKFKKYGTVGMVNEQN